MNHSSDDLAPPFVSKFLWPLLPWILHTHKGTSEPWLLIINSIIGVFQVWSFIILPLNDPMPNAMNKIIKKRQKQQLNMFQYTTDVEMFSLVLLVLQKA